MIPVVVLFVAPVVLRFEVLPVGPTVMSVYLRLRLIHLVENISGFLPVFYI